MSIANISLLMSCTYSALSLAAKATNKVNMIVVEKCKPKPMTYAMADAAAKVSMQDLQILRRMQASLLPLGCRASKAETTE